VRRGLYAGFALDATHIWVGGKYGLLMARLIVPMIARRSTTPP